MKVQLKMSASYKMAAILSLPQCVNSALGSITIYTVHPKYIYLNQKSCKISFFYNLLVNKSIFHRAQ